MIQDCQEYSEEVAAGVLRRSVWRSWMTGGRQVVRGIIAHRGHRKDALLPLQMNANTPRFDDPEFACNVMRMSNLKKVLQTA